MSNIGAHQDNSNTTVIKEMYDILQESKEDLSTIKYHYALHVHHNNNIITHLS